MINASETDIDHITLEALIEACSEALYEYKGLDKGISKRSIQEDIKDMCSGKFGYEAQIVREDGIYTYSNPTFSIFNTPLLKDDVDAIRSTIGILNQFSELGQTDALRQIESRLRNLLATYDEDDRTLVQFAKATYPAAEQWLKTLYGYVKRKSGLSISYKPFTYDTPATFRAFPLVLKEYNGRWFLIGHNSDANFLQNFVLDRIAAVAEDTSLEEPSLAFEPIAHYQYIMGVSTAERGIETIRFRTTPTLKRYLATKPLHLSQRVLNDETCEFEVTLDINFEMKAQPLGFGPALIVLTPRHLRDDLIEQIRQSKENYEAHN